ncbi:hypothetical protein SAMN02983003_3583 [Devosia enhydra]|uniref:Uncharacterized protein n=2 Tax=Devosia enhydra TaxID=665118 RepID=A0A1K2I2F6_9HYPH|nr:hypothetical protein SAMN02983003_3583 [Devosia enhydra]
MRGVAALAMGDRKGPGWFDFSDRGLVGSFIALLAVIGINAGLPLLLGIEGARGSALRSVITFVVLLGAQLAAAALVLRQIGRQDGLVPYIVADNWAIFTITMVTVLLSLLGVGNELTLLAIMLLVLIVQVNIARLVVTLSVGQIVLFLIAQLVGGMVGLLIILMTLPLPPELAAELAQQAARAQ